MGQVNLNLARKWRSKQFGEVVGQDLAVRILQNSLFKNTFFPVYLFSGQRGCGKTSTARVFASAMNCQKLSDFQKDPKNNKIPCLSCDSCVAMSNMRHPDFVEIDAASYTGVDNIRNIIDTSSFLPVLSKRKVYLIDEVHMLSKAAFNALLKILEEPPEFVVFILATTEIQKLPETVKSRCFQLFFNAIDLSVVTKHLQKVCDEESISYEHQALELIAQASEGSLRDAINLLEQARFAHDTISKKVVYAVLGYIEDDYLFEMVTHLLKHDHEALLKSLSTIDSKKSFSVDYVLQRLQELLYDIIMVKHDVPMKYFVNLPSSLTELVESTDISYVLYAFNELSRLDEILAKTSKKQLVFQGHLVSIALQEVLKKKIKKQELSPSNEKSYVQLWATFIQAIEKVVDPVLFSMLFQSELKQFDVEKKVVHVNTLKKFIMFQDLFIEQKNNYQPLLERCFGQGAVLFVHFEQQSVRKAQTQSRPAQQQQSEPRQSRLVAQNYIARPQATKLDISDEKKWKLAHTLLKHFGGTLSEIVRKTHESDA